MIILRRYAFIPLSAIKICHLNILDVHFSTLDDAPRLGSPLATGMSESRKRQVTEPKLKGGLADNSFLLTEIDDHLIYFTTVPRNGGIKILITHIRKMSKEGGVTQILY